MRQYRRLQGRLSARLLYRAEVRGISCAERGAQHFVGPLTFSALCNRPCVTDLWHAAEQGGIGHVELAQRAELVIVAPATANMLAKMAHGMGDDPLCALLLDTPAKVLVAPAMETGMWQHPATQANLQLLEQRGVHICAPAAGPLASGRQGLGRLREPADIVAAAQKLCTPQTWVGRRVLVTAGPTREALDPARYCRTRPRVRWATPWPRQPSPAAPACGSFPGQPT